MFRGGWAGEQGLERTVVSESVPSRVCEDILDNLEKGLVMKNYGFLLLLCMLMLLSACKKDDSPLVPSTTVPTLLLQGSSYSANTKVSIFTSDSLRQGYNPLYIQFTDSASGSMLETVNTTVTPMMYMTTMTHACPVEQCGSMIAVNNFFPCAVVFSMPTSLPDHWMVKIAFSDTIHHVTGMAEVPVTVVASSMVKSFIGTDSAKYLVTMKKMDTPKVGMNDCEFLVHKRQDMMNFPCVEDLTIEMTPDMPSMGHGSPNNENPTHISAGHYKGRVNFTMTGEWRITLVLKRGNAPIHTSAIEFWVTL